MRFDSLFIAAILFAGSAAAASPPRQADAATTAATTNPAQMEQNRLLFVAASNGNVEGAKSAIAKGADVNFLEDRSGAPALFFAVAHNYCDVVKVLLAAKANPNIQNYMAINGLTMDRSKHEGATAIMLASMQGYSECVKALIAAKADLNIKDMDGYTALMVAAQDGQTEIVRLLLAAKAEVNIHGGKPGMVLVKNGTSFVATNAPNGITALLLAKANKHSDIMDLLKQAGATE